ncbi:hypothetical protein FB45DRAFT_881038 [Roridomyces roridus]|uniref:Uncharacterized protein n=1 Tax=Roridomyces roridus TaxID=1738132 RepID=A0AAD7AY88_9AGAR|nr:hypothetical protein FB45DRAFT_881038 [Roridomyces roridus]
MARPQTGKSTTKVPEYCKVAGGFIPIQYPDYLKHPPAPTDSTFREQTEVTFTECLHTSCENARENAQRFLPKKMGSEGTRTIFSCILDIPDAPQIERMCELLVSDKSIGLKFTMDINPSRCSKKGNYTQWVGVGRHAEAMQRLDEGLGGSATGVEASEAHEGLQGGCSKGTRVTVPEEPLRPTYEPPVALGNCVGPMVKLEVECANLVCSDGRRCETLAVIQHIIEWEEAEEWDVQVASYLNLAVPEGERLFCWKLLIN